MQPYSISRAFKADSLRQLVKDLYFYDADLYQSIKHNEGQYSYLSYVKYIRKAIDCVFYKPLPWSSNKITDSIITSTQKRSNDTCIILNNNSLLAHVTVLRSFSPFINNFASKGNVQVLALSKSPGDQESKWKSALHESKLSTFDSKITGFFNRFIEVESLLRPRQYIWWAWPPGQWMGPLLAPSAIHRSVSFKYDFPSAAYFDSHHIGYGETYARHINDSCPIFGFNQIFNADLIPGFSYHKAADHVSSLDQRNENQPLNTKSIINAGTLGRSEKIAQPSFLSAIKSILLGDQRVVFHWTGVDEREDIVKYFHESNLSDRVKFHGWVEPFHYLSNLDIYLDTFPYGTGETFVMSGLMGLPIVALYSPFEANFSNLLAEDSSSFSYLALSPDQYVDKALAICSGSHISSPQEVSCLFSNVFCARTKLTSSIHPARFIKSLDL